MVSSLTTTVNISLFAGDLGGKTKQKDCKHTLCIDIPIVWWACVQLYAIYACVDARLCDI